MKIWITKKNPYEFVMRGMDSLEVWFIEQPTFRQLAVRDDVFKETLDPLEYQWPTWIGRYQHSLSGKILRKMGGELAGDVWGALCYSYAFDQTKDLYGPVREYYDAALIWYQYRRPGRTNSMYYDRTHLNRALHAKTEVAAERYASKIVEKEGQRWWEWMLEYDIEMNIMENENE